MNLEKQSRVEKLHVVFIGAGNLATHLAQALFNTGGCIIDQVYSRTLEAADSLATKIKAEATTDINKIKLGADLYIVALRDNALTDLIHQIMLNKPDSLVVHTSGSTSMSIFEGLGNRYGVLYPMQTFSKDKKVDFSNIHFFIEANNTADCKLLTSLVGNISKNVHLADSMQRKKLHLAAVFVCNFTNHMYTLATDILEQYDLPFDAMLSLIDETTEKIHSVHPKAAQTGPAVREDTEVMNKHLAMLSHMPDVQEIYRKISKSIIKYNN